MTTPVSAQESQRGAALGSRPEDATDSSSLIGQLAASGDIDAARAFLDANPDHRAALDTAVMGQRDYGMLHALAQPAATPAIFGTAAAAGVVQTPAAPPKQPRLMPEARIAAFQKANPAAVAAGQKQMADLSALDQKLTTRMQADLTLPARQKGAALGKTINDAQAYLAKDVQLRADADLAIANSALPKGELGKDPAVKKALDAVAIHAAAQHPATTPGKLASFGSSIDKLTRADVPVWSVMRDGKTHTKVVSEGPSYPLNPQRDIASSPAWNTLIANGTASSSTREVVSTVATNEGLGSLDAVQAYDDQIASLGAMQKTISPTGQGELPKQVYEFSQSDPASYKALFADKGWTAAHTGQGNGAGDYTMSYQDPGDPKALPITGTALSSYVKQPNDPARWQNTLGPLLQAGRDPAFQQKQIGDFVGRLNDALAKVPAGFTQPISSYVTSQQGAALVLDQDVNRPSFVARDFGKALNTFFSKNPTVNRDPTQWTAQERQSYERDIVKDYIPVRVTRDSQLRATNIQLSPLKPDAGSL
ncbi:MAG TPA: hypothetical protein VGC55_00910 [Dokdonella sp.]